MKQETFLYTCKVLLVNLPLLFDEEYIVTKTHSLAPPFWLYNQGRTQRILKRGVTYREGIN